MPIQLAGWRPLAGAVRRSPGREQPGESAVRVQYTRDDQPAAACPAVFHATPLPCTNRRQTAPRTPRGPPPAGSFWTARGATQPLTGRRGSWSERLLAPSSARTSARASAMIPRPLLEAVAL
jgi:hypothetical protein